MGSPLGVSHVITSQGPHGNEVAKVRSGLWTPPLLCLCTRTKEFSCVYVSADWCNKLHASSSCSRCHDVEVDVAGWGRGPGCEVIINHPLVCTHCLHSLSGGILNRGINYQHRLPYHRVQWLFCLPAQTSLWRRPAEGYLHQGYRHWTTCFVQAHPSWQETSS